MARVFVPAPHGLVKRLPPRDAVQQAGDKRDLAGIFVAADRNDVLVDELEHFGELPRRRDEQSLKVRIGAVFRLMAVFQLDTAHTEGGQRVEGLQTGV